MFLPQKKVVSYFVIFGGTAEKDGTTQDEIRVINFCKNDIFIYELQYFISFLRKHLQDLVLIFSKFE